MSKADAIKVLGDALDEAATAIDDWVVIYASDMCGEKARKETQARIDKHGGTLGYTAYLAAKFRHLASQAKTIAQATP